MGVITNIINTKFTSSGAAQVTSEAENITRSQTRLGQASAGAGRNFAAQSKGLGGLVGAYAGAAATVFALQAAFTALNNAAKAENMIKGTNALAAEVASSGPQILAHIKAITNGQVSMAEAAQNANIALSAGFSTNQIDKLTEAAYKTSKALGRDLTDSMTRLVRGTAKLEPELLDELGIFVRLDTATRKYAAAHNTTASSLTEFQRRQAFLNATLAEADRKFSSIDTTAPSAQQSLERLMATIVDLSNSLGSFIGSYLAPLADFFANDLGNSLVLFGAVLLTVFSKAKAIAIGFTTESMTALSAWVDKEVTSVERVKSSYESLAAAQLAFAANIKNRGGLAPMGENGSFSQMGVPKDIASRLANFRKEFQGGHFTTLSVEELSSKFSQLEHDLETMGSKGANAGKKVGDILQGIAQKDAQAMHTALKTALESTTTKTKLLTIGLTSVKFAIQGIGMVASKLLTAFNWIFVVTSVLELLGFDVMGKIAEGIEYLMSSSKQAATGLTGAFASAAGGASALTARLKDAGATKDQIDNLASSVNDLYSSIISKKEATIPFTPKVDTKALEQYKKELTAAQMSARAKGEDMNTGASVTAARAKVEAEKARLAASAPKPVYATELSVAQKALTDLKAATAKLDPIKIDSDTKMQIVMLETLVKTLKEIPEGGFPLIGAISERGGLDATKLADVMKTSIKSSRDEAGKLRVTLDGISIPIKNGKADFDSLSENMKTVLTTSQGIKITTKEVFDSFNAGTSSAEMLSKQISGLDGSFDIYKQNAAQITEEFIRQDMSITEATLATNQLLALEKQRLEIMKNVSETMTQAANIQKSIASAFGSEIKKIDTAQLDGTIALTGEIATNEQEIAVNRATALKAAMEATSFDQQRLILLENMRDKTDAQAAEYQKILALSDAHNAAIQASHGLLLSVIGDLQKMNKEISKAIDKQQSDNYIAGMESALEIARATADLQKTTRDNNLAIAQMALDTDKQRLSLAESQLDYLKQQAKAISDLTKKDISRATPEIKDLINQRSTDFNAAIANFGAGTGIDTSGLTAAAANLRQSLEGGAKSQKDVINRQEARTKFEIEARKAIQAKEIEILKQENQLKIEAIQNDIKSTEAAKSMLEAETTLEMTKLDAQAAAIKSEAAIVSAQLKGYSTMASIVTAHNEGIGTFGQAVNSFGQALSSLSNLKINLPFGMSASVSGQTNFTPAPTSVAGGNLGNGPSMTGAVPEDASDHGGVQFAIDNLISKLEVDLPKLTQLQLDGIQTQKDKLLALQDIKEQQYDEELRKLNALEEATKTQNGIALQQKLQEQRTVVDGLKNDLIDLGTAAGGGASDAIKELTGRLAELQSSIGSTVKDAMMSLSDLVFYGEGSAQDIAYQFFRSLQESLYEKLIAEPLTNMISNWLTGAVSKAVGGVDILGSPLKQAVGSVAGAKKADLDTNVLGQMSYTAGTSLTSLGDTISQATDVAASDINSAATKFRAAMNQFGGGVSTSASTTSQQVTSSGASVHNSISTIGTRVQTSAATAGAAAVAGGSQLSGQIQTTGATVAQGTTVAGTLVGTAGTMFSSLMSTMWPMLLMFGLSAITSKAAGGAIQHLASGGQLRDRVPAMLEPGEFVIRKPAAKKIGMPALQQMNATGNTNGAGSGNVTVNMSNSGTQKEAEASKPRFDGEKYVIDIVLRDLSSNGPIRKSLRGGSI